MSSADQLKKPLLVQLPISVLGFLVRIENIRRRRELGEMYVFDVADCSSRNAVRVLEVLSELRPQPSANTIRFSRDPFQFGKSAANFFTTLRKASAC